MLPPIYRPEAMNLKNALAMPSVARFQAEWIPVGRQESAPINNLERIRTQNRRPLLLNAL
jgi:hypothetical protein